MKIGPERFYHLSSDIRLKRNCRGWQVKMGSFQISFRLDDCDNAPAA